MAHGLFLSASEDHETDPFAARPMRASVAALLADECDALADDGFDPGLDDCDDLDLCEAHGHGDCERCFECQCGCDCDPGTCDLVLADRREGAAVDRWLDDRD